MQHDASAQARPVEAVGPTGMPLTERILAALPGPGWAWVALWAFLVLIRPVFLALLLRMTGNPTGIWEFSLFHLAHHVVYAYMNVLCFWGVRKLAGEAMALKPALEQLSGVPSASSVFAGVNSLAGPLTLTALLSAITFWDFPLQGAGAASAIVLPYIVLALAPMMTLFWVYLIVLLGLDAIGRQQMALGPFPEDCSLGLAPVGALGFSAFLIFCAGVVPFLLVQMHSRFDLVLGLTFFVSGVATFFLSMWRLHRQMLEAKRRHVAWARQLYAEAYQPVRERETLEAVRERAPLVSAAEALEKRAAMIQEWPFDDRTMTRIVAISTGVVTAVISRMVLRSIGL